jgi:hypothetical protein
MLATILDVFKSGFNLRRYIKVGRKMDKQQIEINDLELKRLREEDIAKQQADVIIQLMNNGGESYITIKNQGHAIAKNLRIVGLDSLIYDVNISLPCDINTNEEVKITITHTKDTPSSAHIICIWDDEYGDSRKYEQKFNFYS